MITSNLFNPYRDAVSENTRLIFSDPSSKTEQQHGHDTFAHKIKETGEGKIDKASELLSKGVSMSDRDKTDVDAHLGSYQVYEEILRVHIENNQMVCDKVTNGNF